MNYFWLSFKAIFIKDIVTELRAKQVLPTMIVLGMLIVWIIRIASEAAAVNQAVMGSAALWVAFLFSGLLAQERSFAAEQEQDCIYGLLLAPVDEGTIYLAKMLVNVMMLCIFEIIIVPLACISFQLSVSDRWPQLIIVLLLGNIGISSIGTLFSAVTQLSRMRGDLLSIVVLVILMPMMVPATFALFVIFGILPMQNVAGSGALSFVGGFNSAVGYMIAFDAVFTVACWLLFGFIIKE
ncbi:MAG: heme exporter protein CcmB [Phycisphaerae bacterium]|nr:heme exporter protein CcmB [Phycisphaerae bacterium]